MQINSIRMGLDTSNRFAGDIDTVTTIMRELSKTGLSESLTELIFSQRKGSKTEYVMRAVAIVIFVWSAGLSQPAFGQPTDPSRWIGLKAPEFRLSGTDGETHRLSTILTQGPAVIVWFPKAYTGNVIRLLKSADAAAPILAAGQVTVMAASCDKIKYLGPFARETGLGIPILADPTRTTAIQWGVVYEGREIPQRWAYFIGRDGRIAAVLTDLEADRTGEKLLAQARKLGWIE